MGVSGIQEDKMAESVIVVCDSCGTKNRIPRDRIDQGPLCGRCKHPLGREQIFTAPVTATDQTFDQEVLAHRGGVIVDFWASWCGHCKTMEPVLSGLAKAYAGRIKIVKVNVDENASTAARYRIMSLPSLVFFKAGKVVDSTVGALSRGEIETRLKPLL
jgi:thioredoxin 2